MSKRKDKHRTNALYDKISGITARPLPLLGQAEPEEFELDDSPIGGNQPLHEGDGMIPEEVLASSSTFSTLLAEGVGQQRELPKMKKFRFQLLHQWILQHTGPCRVADVGGGKGLLAYLLQESGWQATVIDPIEQALPSKYKSLVTHKQTRILERERVPHLVQNFEPSLARSFDLLVAMHAHGCNIQLIDAAAQFGCGLILLPCCIIHEPLIPSPGVHWIETLAQYALQRGFAIQPFRLNFKGQNIGLYAARQGNEGMRG